jgi:hypothetical protein
MLSYIRAILFDWKHFKTLILLVLLAEAAFGVLLIFHPRLSRACSPATLALSRSRAHAHPAPHPLSCRPLPL